jgi:hypothetical protein
VHAHLAGEDDCLVSVRPSLDRWRNFRDLLLPDHDEAFTSLRKVEGIGRPLGTADFVIEVEQRGAAEPLPVVPRGGSPSQYPKESS